MAVLAGTVALSVIAAPGLLRGRGAHANQADAVVTLPAAHHATTSTTAASHAVADQAAEAARVAAASQAAAAQAAAAQSAAASAAAQQAFLQRYATDPLFRMSVAFATATPLQRLALQAYLTPAPPAAPPAPRPAAPSAPAPAVAGGSVWDRIAACESHGNWATHTGNGYSGGLQFSASTWNAYGGGQFAPQAWQASREQQIVVAERIHAAQGSYRAWPVCGRRA
jgi:Transglycosylase-like domain